MRVYRSIKKFRGDSNFWTWFYRILVNLCLQRRRKPRFLYYFTSEKKESTENNNIPYDALLGEINWANNPGRLVLKEELKNELSKAVDSLPRRERTAFILYTFHNLSIRDITSIMNCKEGTIKSHLFRAVRKLRKKMGQYMR
ncbi:RNA polymerase sigma factor [Candidatus Peregrinibacteria bacterium]|nr:RNA polymerase sigma factor [Candidatus Peregrinibacteria bacterium]